MQLGQKAKCTITGFEGTINCKSEYLSGEVLFEVIALSHDGKEIKKEWINEKHLAEIAESTIAG